jgi:hypothetical protein
MNLFPRITEKSLSSHKNKTNYDGGWKKHTKEIPVAAFLHLSNDYF